MIEVDPSVFWDHEWRAEQEEEATPLSTDPGVGGDIPLVDQDEEYRR